MVLASHTVTSSSSRSPFLISITPSSLGLCAVARGSWTGEEEKVEALLLTGSSNELQAGTKGNKSQGTEVPTQLLQLRCKKSHKKTIYFPTPSAPISGRPTWWWPNFYFTSHLLFLPPSPTLVERKRTQSRELNNTTTTIARHFLNFFFSHFAESAFRDASIQDRAAALSFSFPF